MALVTGNSPQNEARQQELAILTIANRHAPAIEAEIERAMRDAGKQHLDPLASITWQRSHAERMTKILTRLWRDAGGLFAKRTADAITRAVMARKSAVAYSRKDFAIYRPEAINDIVTRWILGYGGMKITSITGTTRDDVLRIISEAQADGASERDTIARILGRAPQIAGWRALTIGRTEAHGASQAVSLEVAKMTTVALDKVWLTAVDERARDSHIAANGQHAHMDSAFTVGGESMLFPGDPTASAGEVINCRCVLGYELAQP